MNDKKQFIISMIILNSLILISFMAGCSTPQYQTGLSAKESRMSEELLRGQVLRYKEETEKDLSVMTKFFSQYADAPFTPEIYVKIATALAENKDTRDIMVDFSLSIDRYFLFYDKLKERGGDLRGLKIDFETPIKEMYYSPPIEEPEDPTSENESKESV